jgi:hypothetical protein
VPFPAETERNAMFDDAHASKLLLAPLPGREVWRAMFCGLCATLVGLGLARFA